MTGQDFIGPKYIKKKKKNCLWIQILYSATQITFFFFFPLFKSKLEYPIMYQQFSCCTERSSALYSLACSSLLSLLTDSYIPLEPCIEIAWSRSTNWGGGGTKQRNTQTVTVWSKLFFAPLYSKFLTPGTNRAGTWARFSKNNWIVAFITQAHVLRVITTTADELWHRETILLGKPCSI